MVNLPCRMWKFDGWYCVTVSLEQLHHGGMRRHTVTHTVECMLWTLALGKRTVKNNADSPKQTVTMATDHFALKLTKIHALCAKFSKLKQTMHISCTLSIKSYA